MRLSIIIPLYNKEKYIERCLESIIGQGLPFKDYEIIIVDDGSKDSGGELVQNYTNKNEYLNLHLLKQKNQGPSAARNKGIDKAIGNYLYFLDADDLLANDVLENLLKLTEQNNLEILEFETKELEEASIAAITESLNEKPKEKSILVTDGLTFIAEKDFRNQAWRYLIKRSFLLDTGVRFIEAMRAYEDLVFTATVILKSSRIARVDLAAHRYIKVAGSIVTTKNPKKNLEFIQGMVNAVEELDKLIEHEDSLNAIYTRVKNKLEAKQQAIVYALLIRAFKYHLDPKELKLILFKMKALGAYPIEAGLGGKGAASLVRNLIFLPVFNNKTSLFIGLRTVRFLKLSLN